MQFAKYYAIYLQKFDLVMNYDIQQETNNLISQINFGICALMLIVFDTNLKLDVKRMHDPNGVD